MIKFEWWFWEITGTKVAWQVKHLRDTNTSSITSKDTMHAYTTFCILFFFLQIVLNWEYACGFESFVCFADEATWHALCNMHLLLGQRFM